jgi:hypothetical protein
VLGKESSSVSVAPAASLRDLPAAARKRAGVTPERRSSVHWHQPASGASALMLPRCECGSALVRTNGDDACCRILADRQPGQVPSREWWNFARTAQSSITRGWPRPCTFRLRRVTELRKLRPQGTCRRDDGGKDCSTQSSGPPMAHNTPTKRSKSPRRSRMTTRLRLSWSTSSSTTRPRLGLPCIPTRTE